MFTLNVRGKLFCFDEPVVMGVLNATPDSFYKGDLPLGMNGILQIAEQMLHEGAGILDIGGQSTRPGSERISVNEEIERIMPVITELHERFPEVPLSVDTYQAEVAEAAYMAGAGIINDISGGDLDHRMMETVARLGAPYIAMHMKGSPENMQQYAQYNNVVLEVFDHLKDKIFRCNEAGIKDVIIDPGFGFAKTIEQNFTLLKSLNNLTLLGKPLLVGLSRKATIYKTLGVTPNEALNGSTALHMAALLNGANILRVHDVAPAMETIKLFLELEKA